MEQVLKCGFTLSQSGMQEWISICGKDYLMCIPGGNVLYTFYIYRSAVDDREGLVLKVHGGDDVVNDVIASFIVFANGRLAEPVFTNISNPLGSVGGFHWFGILVEFTVNETLAVANHPYFPMVDAIYGGTACEPFLRVFGDVVFTLVMGFIDGGKCCRDALAEILTCCFGWKILNALRCKHHRIPTVSYPWLNASVGFAGAAVDYRQMMSCNDYCVLACLLVLLSDKLLFENFHHIVF